MNCTRAQERILEGSNGTDLERHIDACEACARFAERARQAGDLLRDHHARATPDAAFAARVVASLPRPSSTLGWAAVRLLPATAALLLVLTAWAWMRTLPPSELVLSSPTDDLVTWVLTNGEVSE